MQISSQIKFLKYFKYVLIIMMSLFLLKFLSVMFYTSRNINLDYPYNSFGFDSFHRFTDYLLIWAVSGIDNIWNLNEEIYKTLPPAPYGYLQFALLRYIPFREFFYIKYINILILLILFLIVNYKIFRISDLLGKLDKYILYSIFICFNYPLFFEVDRANLDIYAGLFLSTYILIISKPKNNKNDDILSIFLLTIVVSLKPSFGLFILPIIFCYRPIYSASSILLIGLSYSIPVLFYGAKITYLIDGILGAHRLISKTNIWCHNIICGFRAANLEINFHYTKIILILFLVILAFVCYKFSRIQSGKKYGFFLISIFFTLIINDPSPDYRLILLIPVIFGSLIFLNYDKFNKIKFLLLIISTGIIFSFTNIYIIGYPFLDKNIFNYFTISRSISILLMMYILLSEFYKEKINFS